MKILVTGHQGYLGTVVTPSLASRGHKVVGLDTGWFRDCLVGPVPHDPDSQQSDLRQVASSWLTGFDAVLNLAALSNDPMGIRWPEATMAINGRAAVALAHAARAAGVRRFVQASTCSVYGATPDDLVVDESGPVEPLTTYAHAKVNVERELATMTGEGFVAVCLRNATAFGFSPRLRLDIVVNELTAMAYLDGVVRVLSNGTPWRPYVHVADIAHAMVAALEAPDERLSHHLVNVGDPSLNLQVRDVATVVAEITGADLEFAERPSSDGRSYRVDFTRLRQMFPDLPPPTSLEAGVQELLDSFRRHGLLDGDRDRLRRLGWLQHLSDSGRLGAELAWPGGSA
ncbi:MAG: SDR family oxidoreductase [Nocardioides sp.]